jgi:hypothetical protein
MQKEKITVSCKRCGKPLTNEKSVKIGYGRKCKQLVELNK